MRIALYEPDIAQNTGAMLRLAACFGIGVDIIEPCGFVFGGSKLRRSGMDYLDKVSLARHSSWASFNRARPPTQRLVLLTTRAAIAYTDFEFHADDTLLLGRETAGVPTDVHESVESRLLIPLQPGLRSLNVAIAAAIVLGEALRQTQGFASPAIGGEALVEMQRA